ncbi:conserved hypothetical protein [Mesorhizobium sp. ORS 3324]|nr:conserved hypothetical protein [Mesorhizobium sp. ORS 3324]
MLRRGIADPIEVTILARAVSDYCSKHHIDRVYDRERIAIKSMCLFGRGIVDPEALSLALERVGQGEPGPAG